MAGGICWMLCHLTWFGVYVSFVLSDGELRYSVVEEMPVGAFVGNVIQGADLASQHDAETLQQFRYRILPPPGETDVAMFSVDETKGIISTKVRVDREQLCPHKAECLLYLDISVSGPNNILTIGVLVDIVDINDNKPSFPDRRITLEIPESASPGISYNLPLAVDLDSPKLGVQRYELMSSSTVFELNVISVGSVPRSLQLLLKEALDRERREFYQVTLMAYDGDDPPRTGTLLIDVVIGDANDHGPVFVNNSYEITVPEDFAVEATILTVQAHDQDAGVNGQITYHIAPGPDSVNVDKFGIIEATGEIHVKETLDYEKQKLYDLVVVARDGGVNSQPAYASVTIHVLDVNDNAPQVTVNILGDGNTAEILETAEVGTFVAHFLVRDLDAGGNGNFSCNLQEPHFHLRQQQRSQYRLVTAAGLDRETQDQFQLTIKCQDYGLPSLTSSVEIPVHVLDANDNPPIFKEKSYSVNLLENSHMDAFVVQVNATDLDLGLNARVIYRLGPEVAEYFKIDPQTGVIRANAVFDYEKLQEKAFLVTAIDGGSPPQSSSVLVSVSVLDTNDEAPQFSQQHYTFEVLENQPKGLEIGVVSAIDPDSEQFSHFQFSLLPSSSASLFDIDPNSGHMSTRATLDREDQSAYFVTVVASNTGDTAPHSSSATITVQVLDSNDNAPIITFPTAENHTVAVSNRVPVGYEITQVEAFDVDQGNNAALKYTINDHGQDTGFYIDSSTGIVATGVGLQNIDTKVFEVEVIVSDLGFPPKSSKQILNISVNRSLAYDGRHGQLLTGPNLTIVIALVVSCGAIVLILVVAIVIIRTQEKQKQQQYVYQCRVEEAKVTQEMERREANSPPDPLYSCSGSVDKSSRKDAGLQPNGMSKTGNSQGSSTHNGGQNQPWPTVTLVPRDGDPKSDMPTKPPRITVGPPQHHSSASVPVHGQNKMWELSIKDLQASQKALVNNNPDDQDSDSAYSGDMSNTDSGRGPSEEGENQAQGVPCNSYPARGQNQQDTPTRWNPKVPMRHHRKHPQRAPPGAHGSNHRLSDSGRHSYTGPKRDSYYGNQVPQTRVPNSSHTQAPCRSSYYSNPASSQQTQKHGGHGISGDGFKSGGNPNRTLERPSTPSEDFPDNASSTSGSYVVDSRDLYQDGFDVASYKSVVV